MEDPWYAIVRPMWAAVMKDVAKGWTSEFCQLLGGTGVMNSCPKLMIPLEKGMPPQRQELALVVISQGGETSFLRFLECLKRCRRSSLLPALAEKLDEQWKRISGKKGQAQRDMNTTVTPWRVELFMQHRKYIEELFINSRGHLRDVLVNMMHAVLLLSDKEQWRVKGKGADETRDCMLLDLVGRSETSVGYLFAVLRYIRPDNIIYIESGRMSAQQRCTSVPAAAVRSSPIPISSLHKGAHHWNWSMSLLGSLTVSSGVTESLSDIKESSGILQSLSLSSSSTAPKPTYLPRPSANRLNSSLPRQTSREKRRKKKMGMSESTRHSYEMALLSGRRVMPHIRMLLCGPGRAGKTSLRKSVLNQKFSKSMDSTLGVELQKIVCTARRRRKHKTWQWRIEKNEYEQHYLLTKKMLAAEVEERSPELGDSVSSFFDPLRDEQPNLDSGEAFVYPSTLTTLDSVPTNSELENAQDALRAFDLSPDASPPASLPLPAAPRTGQQASNNLLVSVSSDDLGASVDADKSYPASFPSSSSPTCESWTHHMSNRIEDLRTKLAAYVQKFIMELYKQPASAPAVEDEVCFVDLWDFAGQYSFATVQHMLLAELRCAYAVVFNASLALMAPVQNTYCREGVENPIEDGLVVSNFDMVESWLNTIHQGIGDEDAPVYVVGCQIDRIPADMCEDVKEAIEKDIWSRSADKAYHKIIDGILFVDNTLSGTSQQDAGVCLLREKIVEKMYEQVEKEPIPLCWLPFTVAVRWLAKEKSLPWLSLQEVYAVVQEVCPVGAGIDVAAMLQFHHHLGHVLHYTNHPQLREYVIIDVGWIVQVISLLFQPHVPGRQDKKFRDHYVQLREKGILLESLAEHIWHKEGGRMAKYTTLPGERNFLFRLMEHFSLLFDTREDMPLPGFEPSRKFYVPALVQKVEDVLALEHVRPSPPLYLCTGSKVLCPQALFWCLVVRCMTDFRSAEDPVLLHNSVRLLYNHVFWLVLTYFQHGIKLVVEHEPKLAPLSADVSAAKDNSGLLEEACHHLLIFIEGQINELKSDMFNFKHIELQRSAHCNCHMNNRQCVKHKKSNCEQLDCRHFVSLIENKPPRCPLGYQLGQPDAQYVAMFWLFPPSLRPQSGGHTVNPATESVETAVVPCGSLSCPSSELHSEQPGEVPAIGTSTVSLLPSSTHPGKETLLPLVDQQRLQPTGLMFHDMKGQKRARIFNAIARKFPEHRRTIVSLLVGPKGNTQLLMSRPGIRQDSTEKELLFEGLEMWYEEEEDGDLCTGQALFDALLEADCSLASFQECKALLGVSVYKESIY